MSDGIGTVLVTGGASGLGAAVVERVRQAGGQPVVLDRVPPSSDVASALVDLADGAATEQVTRDVVDAHGVDAVVTCAGTDACGELGKIAREEWERVIAVNLLGTAAVIRAALPQLELNRGRIVTIGSTLGLRALSDATAYCASKFGVVGFTRALAVELAGRVHVTLVTPGGMATSFFDGRDEQYKPGPDADLMDPARVADVIAFALRAPAGAELRELVVVPAGESSWP